MARNHQPIIPYGATIRQRPIADRPATRILALVGLVFCPIVEWLLEALKWMPYRPPYDMSTLLGSDEQALVTLIQFLFLGVLAASVIVLARWTLQFRRHEGK